MNPIIQKSQLAGKLVDFAVPGSVSSKPNPENEVDLVEGVERSAFAYIPVSGCPHPKQTQVVYVLRGDASRESAEDALNGLGLADLAEREHCILVFPNPLPSGWNYSQDTGCDDDAGFLVRCFATLKGATGVSGFNGMMFHIACTPEASAMAWTLAAASPLDAAAVMLGSFPEGYEAPAGDAEQVAWIYERNDTAAAVLAVNDGPCREEEIASGAVCHTNNENPCVCYFESSHGLTADEVARAWKLMFSRTRRWRNDVHGIYQPRPDFKALGFMPHVEDTSLGLDDGLPRTWFEYVPEHLRNSDEPIPLVLYFHGINCCGLYGAEQSGWAELAESDGFMCVFPDATAEMRWNAWADDRIPSDIDFVMALIDHMAEVHPLDRSRIYLSGFSMGSMFSNALACSYPELFAGVVACNGPHMSYTATLDQSIPGMLIYRPNSVIKEIERRDEAVSPTRALADAKQAEHPTQMPFVQFVGLLDNVGFEPGKLWPAASDADGSWGPTIAYWKNIDGIDGDLYAEDTVTGFASDHEDEMGKTDRFIHQWWDGVDGNPGLYHVIAVKRMPHAVDLEGIELGWGIVKRFSRRADGSLVESE